MMAGPGFGWLRQPLAVFLALSALVFLVHAARPEPDPRTIVITPALRAELRARMGAELRRAPSSSEAALALERWKLDEVAHREALHLGLGRDDPELQKLLAEGVLEMRAARARERREASGERQHLEELVAEYRFVEAP